MNNRVYLVILGVAIVAAGTIYGLGSKTDGNIQQGDQRPIDLVIDKANDTPAVVVPGKTNEIEKVEIEVAAEDSSQKLDEIITMLGKFQGSINQLENSVESLGDRVDDLEGDGTETELSAADKLKQYEDQRVEQQAVAQANQLERRQAQKALVQALENTIVNEFDEALTLEISGTYENFLSTGESWTEGVSLNAAECGGDYCKLVIAAPKNMDSLAQFELDGRILVEAQKMGKLGQSMTLERKNPDGTIESTTYFAKQGKNLPQVAQ